MLLKSRRLFTNAYSFNKYADLLIAGIAES